MVKDIMIGNNYHITLQDYCTYESFPLSIVYKAYGTSHERIFHSHEFSEIALMISGSVLHCVNDKMTTLKKGDIIVIHPGIIHGYDHTNSIELINIMYDRNRLPLPMLSDGYTHPLFQMFFPDKNAPPITNPEKPILNIPNKKLPNVIELIQRLDAELKGSEACRLFYSIALFMELITILIRCGHEQPVRCFQSFAMESVLEFININYQKQISINQLAKFAKMSERSFFRQFKSTMGCSPGDYLINIRLQHAVKLLTDSRLTISEIADKCGFPNNSYFSAMFKKLLGVTPRSFRKNARTKSPLRPPPA
jgi:AraC-like DNA-binding protein